ncbi:MAG: hypothetical protein K6E62_09910 [Lachnospiraceae bacterium]|nr:hypothetical protein [Lachnospiraceae bacterium]
MRNRIEIAPQALIMSAGVIMSIILISLMVSQFERARDLSSAVTGKLNETAADIADSDLLQYDGAVITGADVRNFYRRYFGVSPSDIGTMRVNNGKTDIRYTATGSYTRMTDPTDQAFIRPDELYACKVNVNANRVITDVEFIKK